MSKCLECIHRKPCYSGKDWDAAVGTPCEYFAPDTDRESGLLQPRCKDCLVDRMLDDGK